MTHLNYDVICHRNIQVKYIVQRYHYQAKHNCIMTPVICVTHMYNRSHNSITTPVVHVTLSCT